MYTRNRQDIDNLDILIFLCCLDRKRYALQGYTKDFRDWKPSHVHFLLFGIEFITCARLSTSCTSSPLLCGSPSDPGFDQTWHASFRIILCFLDFSCVDNVYHVVNSYGRLQETFNWERKSSPGRKSQTSATLVAAMIFQVVVFSNTRRCSSLDRLACKGKTVTSFRWPSFRIESIHCLISLTPGRKMRIPPRMAVVEMMWSMRAVINWKMKWKK